MTDPLDAVMRGRPYEVHSPGDGHDHATDPDGSITEVRPDRVSEAIARAGRASEAPRFTVALPADFTAGEAREVLGYLLDRDRSARRTDAERLTAYLLEDDRLAWALAGLRGHGSPDDVDEADARGLVARLTFGMR